MVELLFFVAGAAVATAMTMAIVILGLQWLTGFPFRWGWRRHAGTIGKVAEPMPEEPAPNDSIQDEQFKRDKLLPIMGLIGKG